MSVFEKKELKAILYRLNQHSATTSKLKNKLRALDGHSSNPSYLDVFSLNKCVSQVTKQDSLCNAGSSTADTCSAISSTLCETKTVTMTLGAQTQTINLCVAPGSAHAVKYDAANRADIEMLIQHDLACSAAEDGGNCASTSYDTPGQTFAQKEISASADITISVDPTKLATCPLSLQLANVYLISIMKTILDNMGSFGSNTAYCEGASAAISSSGGGRCVYRPEPTVSGIPDAITSGFEFDLAMMLFQKMASGCTRRELETKDLNGKNSLTFRRSLTTLDVSINDKVSVKYEETLSAKASAEAAQQSVTDSIGDKSAFKTALASTVTEVANALEAGDPIPGMPRSADGNAVSNNALLGDKAASGTVINMDASIASEAKSGAAA